MLRNYIQSRELHFHGRDTQRKSLPFDWGTEFLGLRSDADGRATLLNFASHALTASDRFYGYEPTSDYGFERGILQFPSSIQTPYIENNTVWGRVFEGTSEMGVIVLPQWNCDWEGHVKLCRLLQKAGITSIRLSMPYHHLRKPPHLQRPEYMVSSNIGQTISAAQQAVTDARRAADWLLSRNCRRLAILGTSLGSCIAFLAFAHDVRFEAGVFIHVSGYFSDVVLQGLSTKHVRQSLDGRIAPNVLRDIWAPISPFPFIERIAGTARHMLMFSGRYDPTFLPHLSQQFYDEFDRCRVPYELQWLNCGHYTMGRFPFNAMVAARILSFMKRERDRR